MEKGDNNMTKIKVVNAPTAEEIFDNLSMSPYYNVAWIYMERKGIEDPNIADLFEAFHEIAKVDHKINKRKD